MDGSGRAQEATDAWIPTHWTAPQAVSSRALMLKFESLGGSGHGPEFGILQQHSGAEPNGLLTMADLGTDLLILALESRFAGVGLEENTVVFAPDNSDEWWTKDKRYWMAMRSSVRRDAADIYQATEVICCSLQSRCRKLIEDLEAGEKIFVFKNLYRDLTETEVDRLHTAIRAYGDSTLFYVRYADETHPPGTVEATAPGLLIGYIDHFAFSTENKLIGSSDGAWLALCESAAQLHGKGPLGARELAPEARPTTTPVDLDASAVERLTDEPRANKRQPHPQGGRQIILIGNCQVQAMAGLYKRFVAGRSRDVLEYVPSYQDLSDENRAAILKADIIVEQLFDMKPQADTQAVPTTTPRIFIPMVTAAFLWPFAGSPHPKNTFHPFLTGGPYGGEAADSYLNRLILSGVEPEQAVETYATLDVNRRVNLDRLYEIVMDRQRSRDEAAGYRIADVMEQHFRTEQIFLSPYHPNVRIATALASQFFEQLGARRDEIERMRDCTRVTPFPKGELPFHPSVCRHFGLDFIAPDRRYRFLNEGLFTFREYALRYMRYEWNDALEEGMYLHQNRKLDEARKRLTVAVQRSPLSAAAHNALGHVLYKQGAHDQAIMELRQAVEIEPESAAYHAALGNFLRLGRQLDEAALEFRAAIAADPFEPHYRVLLAHLLRQYGNVEEVCDTFREAIRLDPYAPAPYGELAGALEEKGDLTGALAVLKAAVELKADDEGLHVRLAQMLGRMDRFEEAIAAARVAITLASDTTRARIVLSDLLLRKGDPADSLNEAYAVVVAEPDNAHAYGHLGHVLFVTGELPAAEAAFRRAASLEPRNAHFRHEISAILQRQQRSDEAVVAADEATKLQPGNPHRFVHLAALLGQTGDLAAAQVAQRSAVDLEPERAVFRVALSDLYARNGQLDEALTEAGIAVKYNPNNIQALGHLAHVRLLRGEVDQSEEMLRQALVIEPRNDYLLNRIESLQIRKRQVAAV